MTREASILGSILGCAMGDAIGLPYEKISKRRGTRLLGPPDRHRFVGGRGMVSDDTQHTWMVAQALCEQPRDAQQFARAFARRLRWWLVGVPAGIGSATLRATLKLWCGVSPSNSGVFSAGNGPAMRAAILGAAIDDVSSLKEFVLVSTRCTHTDPKAFEGAFAVALAAWCARQQCSSADFFRRHREGVQVASGEFDKLLDEVEQSLATGMSLGDFAAKIGCARGVSGYIYRTVPVALFAWLRHRDDFRTMISELVACGGDTDTTAAIAGAIAGAGSGPDPLPRDWLDGLIWWPRSYAWSSTLAERVATAVESGQPVAVPSIPLAYDAASNALFLGIVLKHVCRRMLPPW